jgi:hypothetical protein
MKWFVAHGRNVDFGTRSIQLIVQTKLIYYANHYRVIPAEAGIQSVE